MKVKCPECKEEFNLNKNESEENDLINCPECNTTLIIVIKGGKLKVEPENTKYDEIDETYFFDEDALEE